jgi:short subunit dehydrogenase-like uncharacterized protein
MAMDGPYRVAVLGATGYTGRLVVAEARRRGIPLRLVGRSEERLRALAQPGDEVRVADAGDVAALTAAFEGAFAVVSLAGPFLVVGDGPVRAAIAAGAHYLDSTGEQAFARRVYEEHGPAAERAAVVLLTMFGFDYVPGDLAAALAAEGRDRVERIDVCYAVTGVATSRGTKRSAAAIMGSPLAAWVDGRLAPTRFGADRRAFRFPFGERDGVEWGGGEPLTVPRHVNVGTVRAYVRTSRRYAPLGRLARVAAPVIGLAARLAPEGPPAARRDAQRFTVVADADGTLAAVAGVDPYGSTASILLTGVEALAAGEARGSGALAPAEAFEPNRLLERLRGVVDRVES